MKSGTVIFYFVMLLPVVLLVGVLVTMFNPKVTNKAGPNWSWRLGKYDPIRFIFFRQDGTFRRYGRVALLIPVVAALIFMLFVVLSLVLSWFGINL